MTVAIKGLSGAELDAKIDEVVEMLTAKEDPTVDPFDLGELAALLGVRKFPARVKCATLSWHTLAAALKKETQISTE
jgi:nitrogen fixation NifU-like protein